ncbi:ras-domain-containing protein [Polychaeton citri CBS 116435]|uniref:Ras-domain-containing protein n=1 Tax=Polychaeton citri CBS 116435 TaxID=1314669 RepID=A0A9P4UTS8_9PEZI|nr:ras-domain-containing protein [Polychaeton citri CBS 116435]
MGPPGEPPTSLEAKIVVLGSQGVGKTSLVHRYVNNSFIPPSKSQSTVGASFLTTRVNDPESNTTIRLQIWDTAGQERFRSISKLYYRGAHAAILCYDVTSKKSFEEMGRWLQELRSQTDRQEMILHVVGSKSDVAAADPKAREVPFDRCLEYVAGQLYPDAAGTAAVTPSITGGQHSQVAVLTGLTPPPTLLSPNSNRSSGFWGQEGLWDCCHEVSAKDGEGIDEVFRVLIRKLVDQHHRCLDHLKSLEGLPSMGRTPVLSSVNQQGYFDLPSRDSIRLGAGDKRRSWLGIPTPGALTSYGDDHDAIDEGTGNSTRRCC